MRLFVGIAVPEELAQEIAREARTRIGPRLSGQTKVRWSAPPDLHITLFFLGEVAPERVAGLTQALGGIRSAAFTVEVGHPDLFRRVGVLLRHVELSSPLERLQGAVTAAVAQCGFTPEERAYRPHISLARSKHIRESALREQEGWASRKFRAESFHLYRSFTGPSGAHYEKLETFPLS